MSVVSSPENSGLDAAKASYTMGDRFRISKNKKDQGHVSFLRQPENGLIPYTADGEVLKSCDVKFPLKINLLALRDLAEILKEDVQNKKETARELRLVNYVAPYEPVNNDIMNLLAAC